MIEKLVVIATSALLSLIVLYPLYHLLRKRLIHSFREWGPQHHLRKEAVPTAGGLLFAIMLAAGIALGICALPDLTGLGHSALRESLLILFVASAFGLLGFIDDYMKAILRNSRGFPARYKFPLQVAIALAALYFTYELQPKVYLFTTAEPVAIPPWLYFPLGTLLLVGLVNAFNFTDGLDGLASGMAVISLVGYSAIITFSLQETAKFNPQTLAFLSLVLAGAVLAFLVVNFKPAMMYMGDTGSYFLGSFLGITAIAGGFMVYLIPLSLIYGLELLSVMLQVSYFKLSGGKRLLKMSPLHHHLELCGLKELGVVFVFWASHVTVVTIFAVLFLMNQR